MCLSFTKEPYENYYIGTTVKNTALLQWERLACAAINPIESAFGILKNRFPTLMDGFNLGHEDDVSYVIVSCLLMHNMCIQIGDTGEEYLGDPQNEFEEFSSTETEEELRTRDALLYYINKSGSAVENGKPEGEGRVRKPNYVVKTLTSIIKYTLPYYFVRSSI